MPTVDSVIVELDARLEGYLRDVQRADRQWQRTTGAINASARQAEGQIKASMAAIGSSIKAASAVFAGAFTADKIIQLADGYTSYTNQLKVAGLEGRKLAGVQDQLFGIAQKNGTELGAVGALYGRASAAAKDLGASNADLIKFTSGVSAALRVQGGSSEAASGALQQLGQLLGSARVQAEEFNSIADGGRPILQAVANNIDAAGGSISKLKALVNDGKVSNTDFFQAFLKGSAQLEAQAAKANLTIGASFTVLNNALGKYIGETDASLSATARLSSGIEALADNLDTIVPALAVIGVGFGVRTLAAPFAAATAEAVLFTRALDGERVVMLGSAVAAAQKAEAVAAGARTELSSIEATIAARRAEQAVLVQQLEQEAALAAERRAAAALAAASNTSGAPRTAALAAQRKAENDAAFATDRLTAARQRLVVVDGELAVAEGALAGAQARSTAASTAATAAANAATLSARAGAAASKLFAGALTLIGGSVGGGAAVLAIGALVGAILYFRAESRRASEEIQTFNANTASLQETLAETSQYGNRAADAVGLVGTQAAGATGKVRAFAGAVGEAADNLIRMANARRKEAIEKLRAEESKANADAAAFEGRIRSNNAVSEGLVAAGGVAVVRDNSENNANRQRATIARNQGKVAAQERQRLESLPLSSYLTGSERNNGRDVEGDLARVTRDLTVARKRGIRSQIDSLEAQKYELTQYKAYVKAGLSPQAAAEAAGKDKGALVSAAAGRQGDADAKKGRAAAARGERQQAALVRDAAADARAYSAQERQANNDIAAARAELANSAEQRAAIERARIDDERINRNNEIQEQSAQGRFGTGDTAKQRVLELQRLNDQRAELESSVVDLRERQRLDAEANELVLAQIGSQRAFLEGQADLAETAGERRVFELRLLDLQKAEEEARLRAILAFNSTATAAERQAALIQLQTVDQRYGQKAEASKRGTEGSAEGYIRSLNQTDAQIAEAFEGSAVSAVQHLNDELTETIGSVFKLGGVFGSVADSIVSDLIRIAVQQNITKPLANFLFGAGGGGGAASEAFASIGSFFGGKRGRASGGYLGPGQFSRVNEGASPGRVEGLQLTGQGGKIIPLGQMKAATAGASSSMPREINMTMTVNGVSNRAEMEAIGIQAGRAAYQQAVATSGQMFRQAGRGRLPGSGG